MNQEFNVFRLANIEHKRIGGWLWLTCVLSLALLIVGILASVMLGSSTDPFVYTLF